VRHAEVLRHALCVVDVVDRAAALAAGGGAVQLRKAALVVRPTTGDPLSLKIAATAELSTPPLMATAIMGAAAGAAFEWDMTSMVLIV
jgi:hypothetical protein